MYMIKVLHSADWHLDAPMSGHSPEQAQRLRKELSKIPEKLAELCAKEQCDLVLLSGDLFDGVPSWETVRLVQKHLGQMGVPVFISPGNHDHLGPSSPYSRTDWPENVHIFTQPSMQGVSLPELDCQVYGAGYTAMDCGPLLKGFHAGGPEKWHLGVLHGEVDAPGSEYCPITRDQLRACGLDYLALGHIHKGSSLRAGQTLCAWPGCPMGRGFDELGVKGALIVTLDQEAAVTFRPLDTPRFYDEDTDAGDDPLEAVAGVLPQLPTQDHYRITLTGYSAGVDTAQLQKAFPNVPNLTVRDETRPEPDLWSSVGEDSLEGVLFKLLQQGSQSESQVLSKKAQLAARICRQLLDGQEVKLP